MNENTDRSTDRKGIQLTRALKSRHIFMLSLGGVIGTGLFMGSGVTINQGGPVGAILAYLVAGFLMYLVMVCLGELSVQMPVSGSFQTHATKYIGPATGFMIGWVYWMSWATTVGLEFTAAGMLMTRWFPEVPIWYWSALFVVVLFGINAMATRAFGEAEYWFSGIKVAAILGFIVVGVLVIFGVMPLSSGAPAPMATNLIGDSLFPNGLSAVFAVMMTVVYAFQGCEIMGVAAGETDQPEKSIPRAVRNVVFRVLIFYVLAIIVLSAIVPWQQAGVCAGVRHGRHSLCGRPDELRDPYRDPVGGQLRPLCLDAHPVGDVENRYGAEKPLAIEQTWGAAACLEHYLVLRAGVADDQLRRRRYLVHGVDGRERHVRHRDLDCHCSGAVQVPQGVLA